MAVATQRTILRRTSPERACGAVGPGRQRPQSARRWVVGSTRQGAPKGRASRSGARYTLRGCVRRSPPSPTPRRAAPQRPVAFHRARRPRGHTPPPPAQVGRNVYNEYSQCHGVSLVFTVLRVQREPREFAIIMMTACMAGSIEVSQGSRPVRW